LGVLPKISLTHRKEDELIGKKTKLSPLFTFSTPSILSHLREFIGIKQPVFLEQFYPLAFLTLFLPPPDASGFLSHDIVYSLDPLISPQNHILPF
jgi:hypothetical protein